MASNTYQIILNWDKGQPFAERMSAKIIDLEGFENIDPQLPTGGRDGKKDIVCYKNGKKYIVACYYPNGQKDFDDIEKKFNEDFEGVAKHSADGFIFITNQKITPGERITLSTGHTEIIETYHVERACNILDSPRGYGVRLEYLSIEMSKEEQISFLNSHIDLKKEIKELKGSVEQLNKVTTRLAGEVYSRDRMFYPILLPISGMPFTSRLSLEDIVALHRTILEATQVEDFAGFTGIRQVEVWVGKPGDIKENADFIATEPEKVIPELIELLKWWREKFASLIHSDEETKISGIAEFHEKILTIHPFLDGNGRLARTLASLQFKELLGKDVIFDSMQRLEYYNALQSARSGNNQNLNDIFKSLIK